MMASCTVIGCCLSNGKPSLPPALSPLPSLSALSARLAFSILFSRAGRSRDGPTNEKTYPAPCVSVTSKNPPVVCRSRKRRGSFWAEEEEEVGEEAGESDSTWICRPRERAALSANEEG